jgi:hypothetical protein
MKNLRLLLFTLICISLTIRSTGQNQSPNVDPKWGNYYNNNPSGIENNFSGMDFIKVIELVDFIPQGPQVKDVQILKKVLLRFETADLRQMMITGNYFSRTFKHDDYFALYNLYYNKISKETWDKYCPYLLPLMDLDGTVKLH